jgi:hypothetical protein
MRALVATQILDAIRFRFRLSPTMKMPNPAATHQRRRRYAQPNQGIPQRLPGESKNSKASELSKAQFYQPTSMSRL